MSVAVQDGIVVDSANAGDALGPDADHGFPPAQLWAFRGNTRAISFYTRNGFAFDGIEYADPVDPNMVELRMVR